MQRNGLVRRQLRLARSIFFLFAAWLLAGFSPAGAQEQLIKLRVGLGDVSLNKIPFIAAYEAGIYKKNGLDVEQFTLTRQ
jgi:ABC-type nitrate/sulfonate/bicarbonate transport system substrate-binding protein